MTEIETTTGTLADILRHLAAEFGAGDLPEPDSISYHTYTDHRPIVSLSFHTNGEAKVRQWADANGCEERHLSRRTPSTDGSMWLSSQSYPAMGMSITLHGRDPRPCQWLGGCANASGDNPDQLCAMHESQVWPNGRPVDAEVAAVSTPQPEHALGKAWLLSATQWRARCACGWESGRCVSEAEAEWDVTEHIRARAIEAERRAASTPQPTEAVQP